MLRRSCATCSDSGLRGSGRLARTAGRALRRGARQCAVSGPGGAGGYGCLSGHAASTMREIALGAGAGHIATSVQHAEAPMNSTLICSCVDCTECVVDKPTPWPTHARVLRGSRPNDAARPEPIQRRCFVPSGL